MDTTADDNKEAAKKPTKKKSRRTDLKVESFPTGGLDSAAFKVLRRITFDLF